MIEGIVIVLVGTVLSFAVPAHDLLASRRHARAVIVGPLLMHAYPFAQSRLDLDELAAQADAALEQDRLLTGIAGVTIIYDQAVTPR